jgi:hypothetical protein
VAAPSPSMASVSAARTAGDVSLPRLHPHLSPPVPACTTLAVTSFSTAESVPCEPITAQPSGTSAPSSTRAHIPITAVHSSLDGHRLLGRSVTRLPDLFCLTFCHENLLTMCMCARVTGSTCHIGGLPLGRFHPTHSVALEPPHDRQSAVPPHSRGPRRPSPLRALKTFQPSARHQ